MMSRYTIWYLDSHYKEVLEFVQEYQCTNLQWGGSNCWTFTSTYPVLYEVLHTMTLRSVLVAYKEQR